MAYEIGLTEIGLTDLADLAAPLPYPKGKSEYRPYAVYRKLGNGTRRGFGLPGTRWIFGVLTQEERDQLALFCPSGVSDTVYISTRMPDDTYADFVGTMHWPEEENTFPGSSFVNFILEFTDLEELVGGS